MKLLYQTHSPYARKALVFAHEAGLAEQIEVIHHETSPLRRNEAVFTANPLGKVPVLLRPGLPALFDSDVICAYLDTLHSGRKLIPTEGEARWRALQVQAVAQGLADAGIAIRWETQRRPKELRYPALRDGYVEKLLASYDWLEREFDPEGALDIGQVALATALSWLEFRELPTFRPRARLTRWFEQFCQRRSMLATPLWGQTHD
ncbi:glutathione S-transferase [Steroidobacter cummioxidans]|uniref:glutathione S-transferase n=1 Tax=Steroidobacter cummioxidans TaxID=1803913 RepID=UPI000E316DD2|nr:glutathione S-transferase [Steroidobacter cummioxidans]